MTAFDRMAQPITPQMPSRRFAADLHTRLLRAAADTAPAAHARAVVPDELDPAHVSERSQVMTQTITPYLCVHDAEAAHEWYRTYFGAAVSNVIPWEGHIGHSELEFGGAVFYLSDEAPSLGVLSPRTLGEGSSTSFVVLVAAVDEFIDRAVSGGAVLERPIQEAHGSRNGWLKDPFGHRWNIGTPLVDRAQAATRRRPAEPYYLTVSTGDVEKAAAFYGAVLDWEFADPHNGGRHVTNTKQPIGVRPTENQFSQTEPGEIQMWWIVRDFDDAVDRVRAAGGTVVTINHYDSGREAQCEDDQGTLFRLSEPAPGYEPDV